MDNTEDIIDSRDVIERIAALTDELAEYEDKSRDEAIDAREELDALLALAAQAEGYAEDWTYGVALIRDSYFLEYAQELAEDIGAVSGKENWPLTCIDWERAARELDYTAVDFDGITYWVR